MRTTDAQVRKLMDEMHRHGEVGTAALRALNEWPPKLIKPKP